MARRSAGCREVIHMETLVLVMVSILSIGLVFLLWLIHRFASQISDWEIGASLIILGLIISTNGGIFEYMASGFLSLGFFIITASSQRRSEDEITPKLDEITPKLDEITSKLDEITSKLDEITRHLIKLQKDIGVLENAIYALNRGNIEEFRKRRKFGE